MNNHSSLMALLVVFSFSCVLGFRPAGAAETASLDRCFQAAMERSEIIADQNEQITQAEEHYKQAWGSALPTINGIASYLVQQSPDQSLGTSISPSAQPLAKITLDQPLFRGLREFGAMRQTQALTEAQREARRQAEVQLFNDTAGSYYSVLTLERDLQILNSETGLYQKRIRELKTRTSIGRSRIGEALTVEASLSALLAVIEQTKTQLAASREAFAFQTGLPRETALQDDSGLSAKTQTQALDTYLAQLPQRPDVKAASSRLEASEESVGVAKGAHYPNVDLFGNYYLKRYGVNDNVNWDLQLALTVPIYAGGTIQSKVRETASQRQQSELALSRARRLAEEEIRTFYDNVVSDRTQLDALTRARDVSEKNYASQTKDYQYGLVTNLDVLQALTTFQESERALAREGYAARLNYSRLLAATGQLPSIQKKQAQ